mgnify:CR=1 FL=1
MKIEKIICPFHTEKTPSFTYSVAADQFHCFGCGESGTIAELIQMLLADQNGCRKDVK